MFIFYRIPVDYLEYSSLLMVNNTSIQQNETIFSSTAFVGYTIGDFFIRIFRLVISI
jgi:hypothetical protein